MMFKQKLFIMVLELKFLINPTAIAYVNLPGMAVGRLNANMCLEGV